MKTKKISDKQFTLDCINKEFELANTGIHFDTFEDLVKYGQENKDWYSNHEISIDQHNQWKDYFMEHFYDWQPKYMSKAMAKNEFEMFDLNYGFVVKKEER